MKDKEKQIEFKVIDNNTGKEADIGEIALKEDWAKGLVYCDMEGFAILDDGNLVLLDECGKYEYCPSERFSVKFEDSVVLSREEYERLVKTAQGKIGNMKSTDFLKACISSGVMVEAVSTEEQVKQAYEKGCKETAEKFLQLAYDRCLEKSFIKKVEELAKQFGVEIKEL